VDNASLIEVPGPGKKFIFDNNRPSSIIDYPVDNTHLNGLKRITGSASDTAKSKLQKVELSIMRVSDSYYWDGNKWSSSPANLQASGTEQWSYNTTEIAWDSNKEYIARSCASDYAGNIEISGIGNRFYLDLEKPGSTIDLPLNNSYINKLDLITGRASDTGGSNLSKITICISRIGDSMYWNGVMWSSEEVWLEAGGTEKWSYDTVFVHWFSNTQYSIRSRALDIAGNVEIPDGDIIFLFDSETPESSVSYPIHNSCLNKLVVIYGNASDTGGSGLKTLEISIRRMSDDCYRKGSSWRSGEFWIPLENTETWEYPANKIQWSTGTKYNIRIKTGDNAENVEIPGNGTDFLFDFISPTASIEINNGAKYTNSTEVTLSIFAEDEGSGVSQMAFSTDGTIWYPWEAFTAVRNFTLPGKDGTKYVYVKLKDHAGNIGQSDFDNIILDTTPPGNVKISINNNEVYTISVDINVKLNAVDNLSGLSDMSFSMDGLTWTPWESFKTKTNLELPPGDGEKIVYLRISDNAGNFAMKSDMIILDMEPPHSLSIMINGNADKTNDTSVYLDVTAKDNISGIHLMVFSTEPTNWNQWVNFTNHYDYTLPEGDGEKIVYYKVVDHAGNEADYVFDKIELNTSLPSTENADDDYPFEIIKYDKEKNDTKTNINIFIIIIIIFIILIIIIFVIRKKENSNGEENKTLKNGE
jgi:hypothetical protein